MHFKSKALAVAIAGMLAPLSAFATNGMNLEGYGPIATGMGGASMAYDNGTAAMMNNPATLGLMGEGNRVDVAIGQMRPDVEARFSNADMGVSERWSSDADSFLMPAAGWVQKQGRFTYGFGMFAQGGMGTEYSNGGPGAAFTAMGMQMGGVTDPELLGAVATADERSEVGVARLIIPFAAELDDGLTVGGSLDWVRAAMDVQMMMTGGAFFNLVADGRVSGGLFDTMGAMMAGGMVEEVWGAYLDFSDNSDFDGEATGSGFAGKLGATYQLNPQLSIGATYHSKTSLSDLRGDATMTMLVRMPDGEGGSVDVPMELDGSVRVRDFQWPETFALGVAYNPNEQLMLVADVKRINWSDVMEDFTVTFRAGGDAPPGFAGESITIDMPQNWRDQTVFQLGGAYQVNNELTLRAGYNRASNPVPRDTLHYLFPAIIEQHYTVGLGYAFSSASAVDFSLTHAPEVKVTGTGEDNQGLEMSHSQTNWQLMYSYRF